MKSSTSRLWFAGLLGLVVLSALLRLCSTKQPAEVASGVELPKPALPSLKAELQSGVPAEGESAAPPSLAPGRQLAEQAGWASDPLRTFRIEVFDLDGRALGEEEVLVHLSGDPEVLDQMRRHEATQELDEVLALRSALECHPACLSSQTLGPFPQPEKRASLLVTKANSGVSAWLDLEPPVPELVTVRLQAEHVLWVDVRDVLGAPVTDFSVRMALQDAEGELDYSRYGLGSSTTDASGRATLGLRLSPEGLRALAPKTLGLSSYFPPNDHPWKAIPIETLERREPVEWVLPEYGSVELSVDWPEPADDEWLLLAIYDATGMQIDSGRDPRANQLRSSSTQRVPAGQPHTFRFVPAGRRLAAAATRWGQAPGTGRYACFDGPAFQGQFVQITPC